MNRPAAGPALGADGGIAHALVRRAGGTASRLAPVIGMKDSFWDTDLRNGDLLAGGNLLTEAVKVALNRAGAS